MNNFNAKVKIILVIWAAILLNSIYMIFFTNRADPFDVGTVLLTITVVILIIIYKYFPNSKFKKYFEKIGKISFE